MCELATVKTSEDHVYYQTVILEPSGFQTEFPEDLASYLTTALGMREKGPIRGATGLQCFPQPRRLDFHMFGMLGFHAWFDREEYLMLRMKPEHS